MEFPPSLLLLKKSDANVSSSFPKKFGYFNAFDKKSLYPPAFNPSSFVHLFIFLNLIRLSVREACAPRAI